MKIDIKKLVTACLTILWLIVIFSFSNQPAVTSSGMSDGISYKLVVTMNDIFHCKWQEEQLVQKAEELHYPVRKAAHMTEYAILAILLLCHLSTYSCLIKWKQRMFLAELLAVAYAGTDEFHQIFITGRSGNIKDVCIDAIGACIGLLIATVLVRIEKSNRAAR